MVKEKELKEFKYIGNIINIGSSSLGNSFYVEINRKDFDRPFGLLIECGFELRYIMEKLLSHGKSLLNVDAVLITHEHNDHSKSVKELAYYGVKVIAPKSVFDKYEIDVNISGNKVIKEFAETSIADGISVVGLPLQHQNPDGTECENFGYIIFIDNKKFSILFATDTKYITWNLRNYKFDIIFIEANNSIITIKYAIQNAKENKDTFTEKHYARVLNSHMTVEMTAKTLATFDLSNTKIIYLIHTTNDRKKNERNFIKIVKNKLKKENKRIPPIYVADHRGQFIK